MHSRAESLLFASFADGTGQLFAPDFHYGTMNAGVRRQVSRVGKTDHDGLVQEYGRSPDADFSSLFCRQNLNLRVFLGVCGSLIDKPRIKCGNYAVFPQARVLR